MHYAIYCYCIFLFSFTDSLRPKYLARHNGAAQKTIRNIEANVVLRGIDEEMAVHGVVDLKQEYYEQAHVTLVGTIYGLKPNSTHAIHVHAYGDLKNTCYSTSGHFNPDWNLHGGPNYYRRHVGDIGNVHMHVDEEGTAHFKIVDHQISLFGRNNVIGRALVMHALTDKYDHKLTDGGAGRRIACGVIAIKHVQYERVQPVFYYWL